MSQLIHEATHKGGKTLDVLLSDNPDFIENINVNLPGSFVTSDHSPITFSIRTCARRIKAAKCSIYNFKKGNWVQLNNDLSRFDWPHSIGSSEVETGWKILRTNS